MICLDTYSLVEINSGNPKFADILTKDAVITDITMAEFYATLLKKYDEKTADYWYRRLSILCKQVPLEILIKAAKFRIENSQSNISFFDAVGYIYSIEKNMKFVTGDSEFKNRRGVLFIK